MKLSDLDPSDIEQVKQPKEVEPTKLKLSDLHPDDVVPSEQTSHSPVADKIADLVSKYTPIALTPFSSEHTADKLGEFASNHIPVVGSLAQVGGQTVSDALKGAQQGATLGWRDELIGGVKAAGKTGLEALTGELPENKNQNYSGVIPNAYEELLNNYKKYKGEEQQSLAEAKQRSPIATGVSQFAGSMLPFGAAFKAAKMAPIAAGTAPEIVSALKNAQLTRNIGVGAGLGATQGLGESDKSGGELATDVAIPAVLGGAATGVTEKFIAPALTNKANRVVEYLKNQPWAKQLAATIENKVKGGTLFGEQGTAASSNLSSDLSSDISNTITNNVKQQTEQMADAFKQGASQRLDPTKASVDDIQKIGDLKSVLQNYLPNDFKNVAENQDGEIIRKNPLIKDLSNYFDDLENGNMSPKDANAFRQVLKNIKSKLITSDDPSPTLRNLANYIDQNGIMQTLENMSKTAGTDVGQLNTNISQARQVVDPFVQKTGKIVDTEAGEVPIKWSSDLPIESQEDKITGVLDNLAKHGGKTSALGTDARKGIADLQTLLTNAKIANPGLDINPSEVATKLQNQSYLNAAQQRVTGIREKDSIFKWRELLNKYKWAEFGSKAPIAQKLSKILLSATPEEGQLAANRLYQNPKTVQIAKDYTDALISKNPTKISNVVFKIMQIPDAKKALGIDDENENNSTYNPGANQ